VSDGSERFEVVVFEDTELHVYLPKLIHTTHGIPKEYIFSKDFIATADYVDMTRIGAKLNDLVEDGAYIQRGEKSIQINSFKEAFEWLVVESRKGHMIQRYKGLGEMNPLQLWETTMDPDSRRMLKVTIEDAIAADQIFTTLMGDHVEPRREFIETNALNVANLDV